MNTLFFHFSNLCLWKDEDNFFELKNELDLMDLLNNCYEEVKVGIISNDRYNIQ